MRWVRLVIGLSLATVSLSSAAPTALGCCHNLHPEMGSSMSGTKGNNGWFVSNVTGVVTCEDGGQGTIDLFEVSVDGVEVGSSTGDGSGSDSISFDEGLNGHHQLDATCTDNASNTASLERDFKIDWRKPVPDATFSGEEGDEGWWTSPVEVELSCTDATSGQGNLTYRVDDGLEQPYVAPFLIEEPAIHTLEVRCTDVAGNERVHEHTVRIDYLPPEIVVDVSPASGSGKYTVSWSVFDGLSGLEGTIKIVEHAVLGSSGVVCSTPAKDRFSVSDSCELERPPGTYCYRVAVRDTAGNSRVGALSTPKLLLDDKPKADAPVPCRVQGGDTKGPGSSLERRLDPFQGGDHLPRVGEPILAGLR